MVTSTSKIIKVFTVFLLVSSPLSPSAAKAEATLFYESMAEVMSEEPAATFDRQIPIELQNLFQRDGANWGGAYFDGDLLKIGYLNQSRATAVRTLGLLKMHPQVELFLATASISALDNAYQQLLTSSQPNITAIGISIAHSRLLVGAATTNADLIEKVESVQPSPSAIFKFDGIEMSASRFYELNPFSGGAMFVAKNSNALTQGGVNCTFGFAWNPPSVAQPLLVTAGHCKNFLTVANGSMFSLKSDKIFRKDPGATSSVTDDQDYSIGSFISGSLQISEPVDSHPILTNLSGRSGDWAVVSLDPTSSGPRASDAQIYVGLGDTTVTKPVSAAVSLTWMANNKSAVFYTSGSSGYGMPNSSTGRVRMDNINTFPGVFTISTYPYGTYAYISGLWYGTDSQAGGCVLPGDSGGPVYRSLSNGSVEAVGIVSAVASGAPCMNRFTPIATVISQFGGSVKVD